MKPLLIILLAFAGLLQSACVNASKLKPFEKYHLLNAACIRDDSEAVEMMLRIGADPTGARDYANGGEYWFEYTPHIETAIRSKDNDLIVAKILLGAGADANARGTEGATPLAIAVWNGNLLGAKLLIEHGADPFSPSVDGAIRWTKHDVLKDYIRKIRNERSPTSSYRQRPAASGFRMAAGDLFLVGILCGSCLT